MEWLIFIVITILIFAAAIGLGLLLGHLVWEYVIGNHYKKRYRDTAALPFEAEWFSRGRADRRAGNYDFYNGLKDGTIGPIGTAEQQIYVARYHAAYIKGFES